MEKVKFNGDGDTEEKGIHFNSPINDYTLCGITLDGDMSTAGSFQSTKEKCDCKHCIAIVEYCKTIKKTEYG